MTNTRMIFNTKQCKVDFYCPECKKLYNSCYELENINMCRVCFSEDIKELSKNQLISFIRSKRLKKINENNGIY